MNFFDNVMRRLMNLTMQLALCQSAAAIATGVQVSISVVIFGPLLIFCVAEDNSGD